MLALNGSAIECFINFIYSTFKSPPSARNPHNYQSADNLAKRRFLPTLNRAGIDKIRFHDLRHTYASLLLANGAPDKYVQHQLGHSSITMTMDLYTHLLPEVNDKCVNLLNSIVSQAIEPQEKVRRFGT
ncbi:MAG: hypothetical protein DKM23_03615 [Candidatus Melainabacteria bacterium]|nr:MAG: hypothetical protein DKM23_03615 [Candidatus Melainabacteria bacterium]